MPDFIPDPQSLFDPQTLLHQIVRIPDDLYRPIRSFEGKPARVVIGRVTAVTSATVTLTIHDGTALRYSPTEAARFQPLGAHAILQIEDLFTPL